MFASAVSDKGKSAYAAAEDLVSGKEDIAVTVLLLTCNRTAFIAESLASVCGQTAGNWVLVVSDCSDEPAQRALILETVKQHEAVHPRNQFTILLHERRMPQSLHLFAALRTVCTPLVALLDDDDVWEPRHLERALAWFGKNPATGLTISNGVIIDDKSLVTGLTNTTQQRVPDPSETARWLDLILRSFYGSTSGFVLRKRAIQKYQPFVTSCVDIHLAVSIILAGFGIRAFSEPSYCYRIHAGSSYEKGRRVVLDRHELRLWLFKHHAVPITRQYPLFLALVLKSWLTLRGR